MLFTWNFVLLSSKQEPEFIIIIYDFPLILSVERNRKEKIQLDKQKQRLEQREMKLWLDKMIECGISIPN